MSKFSHEEAALSNSEEFQSLTSPNDKKIKSILQLAAKYEKKQLWLKAAIIYGALCRVFEDHVDFCIHAAKDYRLGNEIDASLAWYLQAATIYATQKLTSKAIATLRLYEQLHPSANPKDTQYIYNLCKDVMGDDLGLSTVELRQRADDAPHAALRDNDIFAAFDEDNFEQLLQALTYRKLADQEILAHAGDAAQSLFIVSSGRIAGYAYHNNARKHMGDIIHHGVIGIIPYFMGGGRIADFVSQGESEVLEISFADLNAFKEKIPKFQHRMESLYLEHLLIRQLALSDLFSGESLALREWVAFKMKPIYIRQNEILFPEGHESQDLYLVRSGKLAVSLRVDDQNRYKKTIVSGGLVGEVAIIANNRRTATIRALKPCILMKLNAEDYAITLQKSPRLRKKLEKIKRNEANNTLLFMKTVRLIEAKTPNQELTLTKGDAANQRLIDNLWENTQTDPSLDAPGNEAINI